MRSATYLATLAGLAASCDALASGNLADVAIVDRDSGAVLTTHYYRGEYWVAGTPGARYAIEIRNRDGGRVLAVTSVDGVNVISGATAGWNQSGYVLDPGEAYQVTGWRKSNAEVAAFTFTDSPNSYAERTGRPANVGVIGVALFRERPRAVSVPPTYRPGGFGLPASPAPAASARSSMGAGHAEAGAEAGSPAALAAQAGASVAEPNPEPKLGTGHGERESSYVVDTDFRRMQSEPNEVIHIRYDSLDNLMAMGIVSRPGPGTTPNPFPGSHEQRFVPDPPG
jgi:hypothetical protein